MAGMRNAEGRVWPRKHQGKGSAEGAPRAGIQFEIQWLQFEITGFSLRYIVSDAKWPESRDGCEIANIRERANIRGRGAGGALCIALVAWHLGSPSPCLESCRGSDEGQKCGNAATGEWARMPTP